MVIYNKIIRLIWLTQIYNNLIKINQDDMDKDGYVSFSEFVTIYQNIQEIEF